MHSCRKKKEGQLGAGGHSNETQKVQEMQFRKEPCLACPAREAGRVRKGPAWGLMPHSPSEITGNDGKTTT